MKHVMHGLLAGVFVSLFLEIVLAALFELSLALGRYGPKTLGVLEQLSSADGNALRREVAKCVLFAAAGFVGGFWASFMPGLRGPNKFRARRLTLLPAVLAILAFACGFAYTAPAMGSPNSFGPNLLLGVAFAFMAAIGGATALAFMNDWGLVKLGDGDRPEAGKT